MPLQPIETETGLLQFNADSSFCYRFSRYLLLAKIQASDQYKSGEAFHLLPLIHALTDDYLTQSEQLETYTRKNGKVETLFEAIRWYVPYLGRKTGIFERVEPGWYRLPSGDVVSEGDDDSVDEEIAEDSGPDAEGSLYAFTFSELEKPSGAFPIKIGMTIRDVSERVNDQCKGSAFFSYPKLLKSWPVRKVALTERTVQGLLKLSGQWKSDAPGTEWFVTTLVEIERIVTLVQRETR